MSRRAEYLVLLLGLCAAGLGAQDSGARNSIGTSPFILLTLIPGSGTSYCELEYGRELDNHDNVLVGFDIFQYASPLSKPYSDASDYPGHVLSFGLFAADQIFLWRGLFVAPIVNPCLVDYYDLDGRYVQSGFMLLLCARTGYRFEFKIFGQAAYFEIGGEFDYWPLNANEPRGFSDLESRYNDYSFSPATNIGIKF
jgi:hypothetical protein